MEISGEILDLMLQLDRIAPRSAFADTAAEWLALLGEHYPGRRFALYLIPPDGSEIEAFLPPAQRLDMDAAAWNRLSAALRKVSRSGESADIDALAGSSADEHAGPGGTIRTAVLLPLCPTNADGGVLLVGCRGSDRIGPDERQHLSVIAGKLDQSVRQARTFAALSGTCHDLERKCTLRMTALKKTVEKLEEEIGERKKIEATLVEKEERFKAIADYTYGWESWLGEDGRLLWVNPTVERLTGYSPEACRAMAHYPLDIVTEEDRPRIAGLLERAIAARTRGNDVEFRVRHRSGREKWMALSWQPIYNDRQAFMGYRTSIRDISQRKEAEEKLRRSHDRLEDEVVRRTAKVRALQKRLQAENLFLKQELADTAVYGAIIGESPSIKSVISRIELVAPTGANVLILGESGTGKELVAREIHRHSHLRDRPFIRVNCATIPKDLYESEFFGHVKGAFTSAVRDRIGRFEAADGGTIFLDEVGEIPLSLQGKLLRVLQEGEFERVGEGRTRKVTVRIIAATNSLLSEEVRKKRFREDLYYRLNVFPIEITPLRRRKDDLPLLAGHFLERYAQRLNRPTPNLTKANLMDLQAYDWPGNVRELQNLIERALILSPSGRLHFDLPSANRWAAPEADPEKPPDSEGAPSVLTEDEIKALLKRNIVAALKHTRGKIYGPKGAAELLGVKPTTLTERIKAMGIEKPV
jgi:hydrogenase-4 transcriptional activator